MDTKHPEDPMQPHGAPGTAGGGISEDDVRFALLRVEPSSGFAERVMARTATQANRSPMPFGKTGNMAASAPAKLLHLHRPVWRAAYAAAAVLAVAAGTLQIQHHRTEQREADAAAAQFDEALQVTGHALDHVSAQLQRNEFGQVQRALETNGGGK